MQAVKLEPSSREAREKYDQCKAAVTRARFEAAISMDHDRKPLSETIDLESMCTQIFLPTFSVQSSVILTSGFWRVKFHRLAIPSDYTGIHLPSPLTLESVLAMLEEFRQQRKIHRKYVVQLLLEAKKIFLKHKNLVDINVTAENELTVCGDVHGQYYDLLNIWKLNGNPSEKNMYLFNGDFVDRGSFSAEVMISVRTESRDLCFATSHLTSLPLFHFTIVVGLEGFVSQSFLPCPRQPRISLHDQDVWFRGRNQG